MPASLLPGICLEKRILPGRKCEKVGKTHSAFSGRERKKPLKVKQTLHILSSCRRALSSLRCFRGDVFWKRKRQNPPCSVTRCRSFAFAVTVFAFN
jgi:hypothetical protein